MVTEANSLGYVAAFPISEVVRGINAFTLGARSVNADVTTEVRWTNSWYDPSGESEAAQALLDDRGPEVSASVDEEVSSTRTDVENGDLDIWADSSFADWSVDERFEEIGSYVRGVEGSVSEG